MWNRIKQVFAIILLIIVVLLLLDGFFYPGEGEALNFTGWLEKAFGETGAFVFASKGAIFLTALALFLVAGAISPETALGTVRNAAKVIAEVPAALAGGIGAGVAAGVSKSGIGNLAIGAGVLFVGYQLLKRSKS